MSEDTRSGIELVYEVLRSTADDCTDCGRCTERCNVLQEAGAQTVGDIARVFESVGAGFDLSRQEDRECYFEALREIAVVQEDSIFAVRRCCLCSYCTEVCPDGIKARTVFAALREAFSLSDITGIGGFESTQVDTEWHIFSVYRAVYGNAYDDLPQLADVAENEADTLFFPGCPLVSYAPELTREIFSWIKAQGYNPVISTSCCGSPLKTAGLGERYRAHKKVLAQAIKESGIGRVVSVCPGCQEELRSAEGMPTSVEFIPLPQLLSEKGVSVSAEDIEEAFEVVKGHKGLPAPPVVTVFDSCADRSGVFGDPLRALFDEEDLVEMEHSRGKAKCCGAGGATVLVDPTIGTRRAEGSLSEAAEVANVLVTNCPTCSYTFAFQRHMKQEDIVCGNEDLFHCNYLELVFENRFDWSDIFDKLQSMWTGEYGAWVAQQLS